MLGFLSVGVRRPAAAAPEPGCVTAPAPPLVTRGARHGWLGTGGGRGGGEGTRSSWRAAACPGLAEIGLGKAESSPPCPVTWRCCPCWPCPTAP